MLPTTLLGLLFFATSGLSREDISVRATSSLDITGDIPDSTRTSSNDIEKSEGN